MWAIHSALIETRQMMSIPEFISCIIVLYIQPILCLFGILFNSGCLVVFIMVWSNKDYYRKTAMFIDDSKFPDEAQAIEEFNSKAVKLFYPLLMASNYSSIWLLVLICAHRFHSICHPNNKWKRKLKFIACQSKLCICLCIFFAIGPSYLKQAIELSAEPSRGFENSTKNKQKFISRQPTEYRTAKMTFVVFGAFFVCTTMAVLLRFIIIIFGNLFQFAEFAWLPDLSNLLMNINCLIMPVVCFIFTRGFRDIFFAIRDRNRQHFKTNIFYKKQQKCLNELLIDNEKM
uniref:G_PROTEIN_RECEP_F1_2 domain-containing protein n=2 Tax=Meloidogyne TaxID=189290 RepID=A0A915P5M6_9BILA